MPTLIRARAPEALAPLRLQRPRKKIWTEQALLRLPEDGKYELVDGELEHMPPAAPEHGETNVEMTLPFAGFVKRHKLGKCYDGQTGFWMKSGNLRSPDLSFVSHDRLKMIAPTTGVFFRGAPDLAVEILSPSDRPKRIAGKLNDYFESGARRVLLVDEKSKSVRVHLSPENFKVLQIDDTLSGEDVLPGFKLPLSKLFA